MAEFNLKPMKYLFTLLALILFINCKQSESPQPPVAKKVPKELSIHDDNRVDNYYWMRLTDDQKKAETPDAQTQDVLDYLNAENDYLKATLQHTDELQNNLRQMINSTKMTIHRKRKSFQPKLLAIRQRHEASFRCVAQTAALGQKRKKCHSPIANEPSGVGCPIRWCSLKLT